MKERMQKTSAQAHDFPQRARTESEWYEGVQTFMWMTEDNIVEVPFDKEHLLEIILSPSNLNKAYKGSQEQWKWRYRQDVMRTIIAMAKGQ